MTELEKIYDSYFKDVFLYIYSLSGNKHIAEDVTSETFVKAIKSIDSFKGDCDIRVWLCQIAKNTYYSYLRKNKGLVSMNSIPEQEDNLDIEKRISMSEESMRIHQILHNLEEPYKEVFTLRVFGELSFKQIASLFGKSDNWACVTFHRAKNKIKERLEGYK
ncbi:MAG: sigma-70 family RNA polymerase sigma factor [Tissierellia bacterium]|nr:sigma-70 family RNA polymerase sigma factor [Tissierellia bacterium]